LTKKQAPHNIDLMNCLFCDYFALDKFGMETCLSAMDYLPGSVFIQDNNLICSKYKPIDKKDESDNIN
jgi:hypothetical protein